MTYFDDILKARKRFIYNYKRGNHMDCIVIGQKLVALYRRHEDTGSIDYADDVYNLARVYHETGSYVQAKALYIDSIKLIRKLSGKGVSFADRLNNIALCSAKLGEYDDAVKYLKEAAAIISAKDQEYSPEHLDCLYNLANVYYDMGEYDDAIKLHVTVLFCRREEDNAYTDSLNCIGYAYEKQGDMENSVNYLKRATANIKKLYGVNSEEYLANIYYIAQVYNKKCDYPLAIKNYEEARKVINKLYNDKHPYYADTLNRLAEAFVSDGQLDKALKLRLKALKIVKTQIGENHIYYANSLRNIALIYKSEGQEEKAIEYFSKALTLKREIIGAGNIDYIRDVMLLSGMFIERYEYDKAIIILNETIEMLKKDGGEFTSIIPEINKIFNSIKNIKEIKDSYTNDKNSPIDKIDIFELLKMVEDRISEEGVFGEIDD